VKGTELPNAESKYPQPNAKYRHLYVVARVDLPFAGGRVESFFNLTRAFAYEADARAEIERLNEEKAEKGCYYIYKVVRLVEP